MLTTYVYYGYYFDWTYILVLIGMVICITASVKVQTTFKTYGRVACLSGFTGAEAARRILHDAGITDVQIGKIGGSLTDHYDPSHKRLNLSEAVYDKNSVAAVCVAAHECGHAIQHNTHYAPLSWRTALVPAANIGSRLAWPLILIGLILSGAMGGMSDMLVLIGIALFSMAVLFQVVTLPVEFDASSRALKILDATGMLIGRESEMAKKVLHAAAFTYVASAASSILQLLRLLLLFGGRRRD